MTLHASSRPLAAGAMLLLLAACRDGTTAPNPDVPSPRSAGQTPPGASGDTVLTPGPAPAPAPTPASSIELTVYVGIASPGPDTLRSTPAANARVSVFTRTFTPTTGPDTLIVTETLAASSTTDALGTASFSNLPATGYRIEAVAANRPPAAVQISPPYSSKVAAAIIIRPAP